MILISGTVRLPPENVAKAQAAVTALIAATRAEAGCVEYAYSEDLLEPGLIHVNERWTGREVLDAHLKSPHIATWRTQSVELGISGRTLLLYEVGEGEVL